MLTKKRPVLQSIVAICGAFIAVYGLRLFNEHLLFKFSLFPRMILMVITQWTLFLVPAMLMRMQNEKFRDLGFSKERIVKQIISGILLAFVMSAVLTVFPILLGLKDMISNASYKYAWQFLFEFIYTILGVALAEELVFRGYLFHKLLEIKNSRWFAIILSSVLFGLFHIFSGNLIQVFMTAIVGFIYCIYREKVKDCTLLSLIIAHGLYDGLIVLWVSCL